VKDAEPIYRLITTILDPTQAPAKELAALYHERWEIETALDELKTHLRGAKIVLRRQDSRFGPAGVLWLVDGSLCHPRTDARGRAQGQGGSGPIVLPPCGAGCPT